MAELVVAWDLETCPRPLETLGPAARRRLDMLMARDAARAGNTYRPVNETELAQRRSRVMSTHPSLCWICCAGFARKGSSRALYTATPAGEREVLVDLWGLVAQLPSNTQFVSFNGKGFDVPVLKARSLALGVAPTRDALLDDHPYRHRPHADLWSLLGRHPVTLAELCEIAGIETPKGSMKGSDVAAAVAAGRIEDVARYCEGDCMASLQAFVAARAFLRP